MIFAKKDFWIILTVCLFGTFSICRSKDSPECGKNIFKFAAENQSDEVGTWPWMASLGLRMKDTGSGDWWHFCSATLITDSFLLTAAHCVSTGVIPLNGIRVRLANPDLSKRNTGMIEKSIIANKIFVHPKYRFPKTYYDVAVVGIKPVKFSTFVRPICMPPVQSLNPRQYDGQGVAVMGWGSGLKFETTAPKLTVAPLVIYKYKYCNETLIDGKDEVSLRNVVKAFIPDLFTLQTLCAGRDFSNVGPCQGYGGGPLVMFDTDSLRYVQVGIVSGSIEKCGTSPTIFSRLDHPEILAFVSNVTAPEKSVGRGGH